jgi:hypothetical protein
MNNNDIYFTYLKTILDKAEDERQNYENQFFLSLDIDKNEDIMDKIKYIYFNQQLCDYLYEVYTNKDIERLSKLFDFDDISLLDILWYLSLQDNLNQLLFNHFDSNDHSIIVEDSIIYFTKDNIKEVSKLHEREKR